MAEKSTVPSTEELKSKYSKIYAVGVTIEVDDFTTDEKSYIFKKPSMESYDRFVKMASTSPTKASKAFCLDNIVPEQEDAFLADIEEYPALVMTINDKLFSLLGLSKDTNVKKL